MIRRRNSSSGGKEDPRAEAQEALDRLGSGERWEITDDNFGELGAEVPEHLREGAGLDRGPDSLRAIKKFLREERGFDLPDDEDPDGGGGYGGPPVPDRPHDPLGGGGAAPEPTMVDIAQ